MKLSKLSQGRTRKALPLLTGCLLASLAAPTIAAPALGGPILAPTVGGRGADTVVVRGNSTLLAAGSVSLGRLPTQQTVTIGFSLPLRNQDALADLDHGLYDPSDARYGQYLSADEFTARFAPTQADYDAVASFARARGLTVTTFPGRTLLTASGPSARVEAALGLHLNQFRTSEGRLYRAADQEPHIPLALAGKVQGIIGLNTSAEVHSFAHKIAGPIPESAIRTVDGYAAASFAEQGTGLGGGLIPSDIKTFYNLSGTTLNGAGQTLGMIELGTYSSKDTLRYERAFGLPNTPLFNVPVTTTSGGAPTTVDGTTDEVDLDIDMQIAMAPAAKGVYIYYANGGATIADALLNIAATITAAATDNKAKSISVSYGFAEGTNPAAEAQENMAFQQMMTQGQSVYVSSGDSGSSASRSAFVLGVSAPASLPLCCAVGGTAITVQTANQNETYKSETTWNSGQSPGAGGGGGVSKLNAIPSYQLQAAASAAAIAGSGVSTTFRNIPDVSLVADPNTGVLVYITDGQMPSGWYIFGGTSASAPLWAGFTALVNQNRARVGIKSTLGFPNPALYGLAYNTITGALLPSYDSVFHDINDGSNNSADNLVATDKMYTTERGFDDATGLGTFNGINLITALSGTVPTASQIGMIRMHPNASATRLAQWLLPTTAQFTASPRSLKAQ